MPNAKRHLLGHFEGTDSSGSTVKVWVSKQGRSYYLENGQHQHLCHPSIKSVEDCSRETFLVYQIKTTNWVPAP